MSVETLDRRTLQLHRNSIVVAGHTDLMFTVVPERRRGATSVLLSRHVPVLREGGITAVLEHVGGDASQYWVFPSNSTADPDPTRHALEAIDHFHRDVDESEGQVVLALTPDDVHRAKEEGSIAIVLCFEGAAPVSDDLGLLRIFHRLGIRSIGLTHDHRNLVADGSAVGARGGLTSFGRELVREMNTLGMLIDVSHIAAEGFWDVLETSDKPVIASHSNAAALCDTPLNLDDDQIRALAQAGGVIGVDAMSMMVSREQGPSVEGVVQHVAHMASLVGAKHVGIAPDIAESWAAEYESLWDLIPGMSSEEVAYPEALDSLGKMQNITRALVVEGFSDEEVRGILGDNWLRVWAAQSA